MIGINVKFLSIRINLANKAGKYHFGLKYKKYIFSNFTEKIDIVDFFIVSLFCDILSFEFSSAVLLSYFCDILANLHTLPLFMRISKKLNLKRHGIISKLRI